MTDQGPLHILTVGAHAADQELAAGMLIARYTRAGHRVTVLSLTAGEKGHPRLPAAEYREQKIREAQACCRKLGAETIILEFGDAELPVNEQVTWQVTDLMRRLRPDVLITHWQHSIHRDHVSAHRIAMDALFWARLRTIERDLPAIGPVRVYFSENWEDMEGYEPDIYVQIDEETFEQYCDALASFELWHGGTGWPYSDYYRSLARMRGCLGGGLNWRYAATLKVPPGWGVRRIGAGDLP